MSTLTTRNSYEKPGSADIGAITTFNDNLDLLDTRTAKWNLIATADPVATDDSASGYASGSLWYNATGGKIFVCRSAIPNSAVWAQVWPALEADLSGSVYLKCNGTRGLTAAWDAGSYQIRAETFQSDVAAPTAPLTIASNVKVTNLNADLLDGAELSTDEVASPGVDTKIPSEQAVREALTSNSAADLVAAQAAMFDGVYRQALINGSFQINQQAVATYTSATTPANSDDTYLMDQWILLSDGNDIVDVGQSASVIPVGGSNSLVAEVETANKKFGLLQIIESKDAIKYAGKTASLQFKARTTTGKVVENIRAAVLSWNSTADAVTSDIVDAWGAEGANITPVANWTLENVPANLALVADTWTTYTIQNIAIDTASMANLAVFIWVDDTDCSVDDLLYITDVQLNVGAVCLPYMPRGFEEELFKCQRFYAKSYDYVTPPGTATQTGMRGIMIGPATTAYIGFTVQFPVTMFAAPTVTTYDSAGASGKCDKGAAGKDSSQAYVSNKSAYIYTTDATSAYELLTHFSAISRL